MNKHKTRNLHFNDVILSLIFHYLQPQPFAVKKAPCLHLSPCTPLSPTSPIPGSPTSISHRFTYTHHPQCLLACALVCRQWARPALQELWRHVHLTSNHQVVKMMQTWNPLIPPLYSYNMFIESIDTFMSIINQDPIQPNLLGCFLSKCVRLKRLLVCCLPNMTEEFFTNLMIWCPCLSHIDACLTSSLRSSHIETFLKKQDGFKTDFTLVGSHVLTKYRPALVMNQETLSHGWVPLREPPSFIHALLSNKKTLVWATEISHFGLDVQDACLESVLKRLTHVKHVYMCRKQYHHQEGHHDTRVAETLSHQLEHNLEQSQDGIDRPTHLVEQGHVSMKRIECRLPEHLVHYLARHNCHIMSDHLLHLLAAHSPNLLHLLLPTYSRFSDEGFMALAQSPLAKKIKTFVMENDQGVSAIISRAMEEGIDLEWNAIQEYLCSTTIPIHAYPTFTQMGISLWIESMVSLQELHLDLPPLIMYHSMSVSPLITCSIFEGPVFRRDIAKHIYSLRLSGSALVNEQLMILLKDIFDHKGSRLAKLTLGFDQLKTTRLGGLDQLLHRLGSRLTELTLQDDYKTVHPQDEYDQPLSLVLRSPTRQVRVY